MTPAEVEAKTADLIERLMSHMGLADMGDVLRDCREAADGPSPTFWTVGRMQQSGGQYQGRVIFSLFKRTADDQRPC